MTFPWWLVAILTCKSFVTLRSARFPQESWSGVEHLYQHVSLRRLLKLEQLHQIQRMIGGIGDMLFSTYSQTLNGQDSKVASGEPLWGK